MPNCFLVLGGPRAGTSLVAGILHALGVAMHQGDDSGANEWNPKGFYEDGEFGSILSALVYWQPGVENILANYMPYPAPPFLPDTRERLKELIGKRCALGMDWGVKSARLCYVLPTFIELCPCPVKIIRAVRDEAEAIASWAARAEHDQETATKIVQNARRATDEAIHAAGVTEHIVAFARLLDDTREVVGSLARLCGKDVNDAALALVTPELKRF